MKKSILILAVVAALSGCSSLSTTGDHQTAQKSKYAELDSGSRYIAMIKSVEVKDGKYYVLARGQKGDELTLQVSERDYNYYKHETSLIKRNMAKVYKPEQEGDIVKIKPMIKLLQS